MKKILLCLVFLIATVILCYAVTVTWNPLDKSSNIILSNSDLTATTNLDAAWRGVRANTAVDTAGIYFEFYINANTDALILGVGNTTASLANYLGNDTNGWGWGSAFDALWYNATNTAYGDNILTGEVIGVAYKNGNLYFSDDGIWVGTSDPANELNPAFTGITGTIYPMVTFYNVNDSVTLRANATDCTYAAPAGYAYLETVTYAVSGTIKERETDLTGISAHYIVYPRPFATATDTFYYGATASDGTYNITVTDDTTKYNAIGAHPGGTYTPINLGEQFTGVTQ